jgi:hypothetical protein
MLQSIVLLNANLNLDESLNLTPDYNRCAVRV